MAIGDSVGIVYRPCGSNAPGVIGLVLPLMVALAWVLLRSRLELMVESLALRQQLAIFKQNQPRPRLAPADRLFWVFLRAAWRNWAHALILVQPAPVVHWHRRGFQWFWRWRSKPTRFGRPRIAESFRPWSGGWRKKAAGVHAESTRNC